VDPVEVVIDDNRVVAFDGRVLEIFGGTEGRFHVAVLSLQVSEPDKRGNRSLTFRQSQRDTPLPLDEEQFGRFQVILDALRTAGVEVSSED
jgi:hypothetical protein